MKESRKAHPVSNVKRFAVIARVMMKHGLGDLLGRMFNRSKTAAGEAASLRASPEAYPSPIRIRMVLEELGPSFIKIGQLMSTRADIFPPEYIDELKKLQDRTAPLPFEKIRQVIERELRGPLAETFASFDQEALAAASVAQVHLARLANGEQVAVKVIRPGIYNQIRKDIRLMYFLAERIENSFRIGRIIGAVNLVSEFERHIFQELDMHVEAGNIERFAQNFKESGELYIPRVHWECISKSVLVMEHIEGIKMDRVDEIRAHGIDPQEIARIGLRAFCRQLMEFGLFHADPHPGNTIVMFDGRVSLIDFGIIGYLDEQTMLQIANIFLGYAEHDYDMIMEALEQIGLIKGEAVDLKSFRRDLQDLSEPFYGRSLQTVSVKEVYGQVMGLVLKHQIKLPRDLMLLLKTFIQTESLGKILGSDASLIETARPYAKALIQRGYDTHRILRNLGREVRTTGEYLRTYPKLLQDILKALASGKQRIELRHEGPPQIGNRIERGINRLTVGIVISASLVAASLVLNSSQKVFELSINFLGLHTVSITSLLGLTGYSLATVLGFWLILSIIRSGKL
jgi:ubiquinone biosynthesis protein